MLYLKAAESSTPFEAVRVFSLVSAGNGLQTFNGKETGMVNAQVLGGLESSSSGCYGLRVASSLGNPLALACTAPGRDHYAPGSDVVRSVLSSWMGGFRRELMGLWMKVKVQLTLPRQGDHLSSSGFL